MAKLPEGPSIVRVSDVKVGTKLIADGGFTCLSEGEVVIVEKDDAGDLFVRCAGPDGMDEPGSPAVSTRDEPHELDGQFCTPGEHGVDFFHYIGFWLAPAVDEIITVDIYEAGSKEPVHRDIPMEEVFTLDTFEHDEAALAIAKRDFLCGKSIHIGGGASPHVIFRRAGQPSAGEASHF